MNIFNTYTGTHYRVREGRLYLLQTLPYLQASRGNALPAKIFSVNLDDLYIQGDKGKLTKVRE